MGVGDVQRGERSIWKIMNFLNIYRKCYLILDYLSVYFFRKCDLMNDNYDGSSL